MSLVSNITRMIEQVEITSGSTPMALLTTRDVWNQLLNEIAPNHGGGIQTIAIQGIEVYVSASCPPGNILTLDHVPSPEELQ